MACCSRRTFLTSCAAAAAAMPAGRAALARHDGDHQHGDPLLGIQSYSLRGFERDAALEHIHAWGLKGVEFYSRHLPPEISEDELASVKQKMSRLGIKITGHGVNPFTKDEKANRRWFELARRAGIRTITADPSEDSLPGLDKLVAEYNVRVAIHNHGPGARYDKLSDVLHAIRGRHPLIGACADLGHYIRSNEDPLRAIHLLKGRLFGIHLKDFAERKADAKGVILGRGQLDVEAVFRALQAVSFPPDGCLVLEYEENPQDPFEDLKACVAAATAAAARARG